MRILVPLSLMLLSACATYPAAGPQPEQHQSITGIGPFPASLAIDFMAPGYPDDAFTLIDSRAIQALRRIEGAVPAPGLTREQKLALWIGVGMVAGYLITEWIEDELAFFPE